MDQKSYFAIVLGGGPGGIKAARELSHAKKSVALISDEIGGECMNYGCIPSKALLFAVDILEKTRNGNLYGLSGEPMKPDLKAMLARKQTVVSQLGQGVKSVLKLERVEHLEGRGKIISANEIEFNGTILQAEYLVIATGSVPAMLPGVTAGGNIMDNRMLFELSEIPKSVCIVGGGSVGVEFASFFRAVGSEVTIVEYSPYLIPYEDEYLGIELKKIYEKQGIKVMTDTAVTAIKDDGTKVNVEWKGGNAEFSKVLVAIGRKPEFTEEDAKKIGITIGKRGIETNDFMQTANPKIYAIGDVAGKALLAYTAEREGEIAVSHILGKNPDPMDYHLIPDAIFCHPEIASVGKRKRELLKENIPFMEITSQFSANSRALIEGNRDGFCKLFFEKKPASENPKILGAHMIGPRASELITALTLTVSAGLGLKDLQKILIPHPILEEIMKEAIEKAVRLA